MKKLITLFLIISAFAVQSAKPIIYIDPTNIAQGDGTLQNPLRSLPVTNSFESNFEYQFKAGTTYYGTFTMNRPVENLTIKWYGNGNRPIINGYGSSGSEGFRFNQSANSITIYGIAVTSCDIPVHFRAKSDNVSILSCDFSNCTFAFRARSLQAAPNDYCSNFYFYGNRFSYSKDDLMYLYKVHKVSIINNTFDHANQNWKPPFTDQKIAAGDGAQLILCDQILIDRNNLWRNDTGNKFCIIISGSAGSNGTPTVANNYIKITRNNFKMPIKTSQGGSGLYFGDLPAGLAVDFENNTVEGDMTGVNIRTRGIFRSKNNNYQCEPGINMQPNTIQYSSQGDTFKNPALSIVGGKPIN